MEEGGKKFLAVFALFVSSFFFPAAAAAYLLYCIWETLCLYECFLATVFLEWWKRVGDYCVFLFGVSFATLEKTFGKSFGVTSVQNLGNSFDFPPTDSRQTRKPLSNIVFGCGRDRLRLFLKDVPIPITRYNTRYKNKHSMAKTFAWKQSFPPEYSFVFWKSRALFLFWPFFILSPGTNTKSGRNRSFPVLKESRVCCCMSQLKSSKNEIATSGIFL